MFGEIIKDNYYLNLNQLNPVLEIIAFSYMLLKGKSFYRQVQVGKDQEKAQSEKDSLSKNRDGKKLN